MFALSLKDYVYGGLIAAIVAAFGWYTIHERHAGAAHEIAALQKSSTELQQAANQKVAQLTTQHAAQVAAIVGVLDDERKTNAAAAASDAQRLRDFDAYRRAHGAVAGAEAGPGTPAAGASSDSGDEARLTSLEQVALQLATANRDGSAALTACMADRDALTGK